MAFSSVRQQDRDDSSVDVVITASVEGSYATRGVFPEFRLRLAHWKVSAAAAGFTVSLDVAREILADAESMLARSGELPRGLPKAFGSLAEKLRRSITEAARRGLWECCTVPEVVQRQTNASSALPTGTRALHFVDADEYGVEVEIIKPIDTYTVEEREGMFVDEDGSRLSMRPGYVVREVLTGKQFFTRAGELTDLACRPSHLRLVGVSER